MKRQIRRGVFETNSSSTHSICISKAPVTLGKHIYFAAGEYGWENACVDASSYLYTAILEMDDKDELINKLKGILDKYSIEYTFKEPSGWYGIDHVDEAREFIDAVLSDEDMLMRCLFGDSIVYTGNDNQDDDPGGCNIADEYIWIENEDGEYIEQKNPYYDPEHYEYFIKGN